MGRRSRSLVARLMIAIVLASVMMTSVLLSWRRKEQMDLQKQEMMKKARKDAADQAVAYASNSTGNGDEDDDENEEGEEEEKEDGEVETEKPGDAKQGGTKPPVVDGAKIDKPPRVMKGAATVGDALSVKAEDAKSEAADPKSKAEERKAGEPAAPEQLQCVSWRQTGGCDPKGEIERFGDIPCETPIGGGRSGFCECRAVSPVLDANGKVKFAAESIIRVAEVGCDHRTFSCKDACDVGSTFNAAPVAIVNTCTAFHRTRECQSDEAPDVNIGVMPCSTMVQDGWSGRCICSSSVVMIPCDHPTTTCELSCGAGTIVPVSTHDLNANPLNPNRQGGGLGGGLPRVGGRRHRGVEFGDIPGDRGDRPDALDADLGRGGRMRFNGGAGAGRGAREDEDAPLDDDPRGGARLEVGADRVDYRYNRHRRGRPGEEDTDMERRRRGGGVFGEQGGANDDPQYPDSRDRYRRGGFADRRRGEEDPADLRRPPDVGQYREPWKVRPGETPEEMQRRVAMEAEEEIRMLKRRVANVGGHGRRVDADDDATQDDGAGEEREVPGEAARMRGRGRTGFDRGADPVRGYGREEAIPGGAVGRRGARGYDDTGRGGAGGGAVQVEADPHLHGKRRMPFRDEIHMPGDEEAVEKEPWRRRGDARAPRTDDDVPAPRNAFDRPDTGRRRAVRPGKDPRGIGRPGDKLPLKDLPVDDVAAKPLRGATPDE